MKKTPLSALALSVAMSTTLVVTPAEAQPAAPNFQQIQKQIDATTRNALMNLWAPTSS